MFNALNTEGFRGSLKEAYQWYSMAMRNEVLLQEETKNSDTGEMISSQKKQMLTIQDEIKLRAKKPTISKADRTANLNY